MTKLKPHGDYENGVKVTEGQVDEIAEALETTTSDETKMMQDISKTGVAYNPETEMTEVMSMVSVDSETGLASFDVASKEVDSPTLEELLNDENADIIKDIKVSDATYQKAGELFDLKDVKMVTQLIEAIKRYKRGEKFDYYAALPPMLKNLVINMTHAGVSKKQAAEDILKIAADDLGIQQSHVDFVDMMKSELQLPNMTEMYADYLKERIEVGYEKLAKKFEEAGAVKKAKLYRDVITEFRSTYKFDKLFEFVESNKPFVRRLHKEIKKWERYVREFNYKYKESRFTITDIHLIINSMMRALETTIDIDDAKKVLVLIVKSTQNCDSNDVVQHTYMYYLVYNFICLDHVAPGKSEFMDEFKSNIVRLVDLIKTIEKEKV